MKKKTISKLLVALACTFILTGCDSDDITNYPKNATDPIYTITNDNNGEITDNQYSDIYKTISTATSSAQMLDNMLYDMAKGGETWFQNGYLTGDFAVSDDMLKTRYQKLMMDTVKGGSYSTDNKFSEYRYALSLYNQTYTIKDKSGNSDLASLKAAANKDLVITPEMKFDDIFALDYTDYINRYFKPTLYRRYLTARYIYDQAYTSIGNTYARNVTVVKITDRSDKPGEALKLINGFISKYITDKSATKEQADLHNLARLWKGVDITTEEKTWIHDTLATTTLADKIDEEIAKIKDNQYTTDATLESQYTGAYTYPVTHGKELAINSLKVNDLITEGTYLKSSGLSSLPSDLKNSIFGSSSAYSTNVTAIEEKTASDSSYIITHDDGTMYRYVKPIKSLAGSTSADIVTFDSTSATYYIAQINVADKSDDLAKLSDRSKIVTTSRIAKNDSDSAAVKAFKRDLAYDAAYEMASADTNKKAAITWYFTHNKISYSDPDFYSYMKTNYPDCFNSDGYPVYNKD
ncbi:MAG: hypothetical protein LKJ88_06820 [Bacilli bacterium]|jgi:hypothetical protein|nr:hypothetical protein [Bacilli bacterium]